MSSTFSNISIMISKTNHSEAYIRKCLQTLMKQKGYELISSDIDAEFIFAVKIDVASRWMTLYSDSFDGNQDELDEYAVQLSTLFRSPVLCTSCFDSNFLQLHLIHTAKNIDTFIANGRPYDEYPLPVADYKADIPPPLDKDFYL